jgi:hypothetical protein
MGDHRSIWPEALEIHSSTLFIQREFVKDIPVYRVLKNVRSSHNLEE